MSITFSVDRVAPATERASEMPLSKYLWGVSGRRRILASDGQHDAVAAIGGHPFASAAHCAFAQHRPLILSPDAVWMTIAQGFAQHVARNPEAMRGRLVDHHGTRTVQVEVFNLSSNRDWTAAVDALAAQVRDEVPELGELLANDFTTSTQATRTAGDIALLDAVQHYYSFELSFICGIPEVTLLGAVADWEKIEARVARLDSFGLGWWSRLLAPVCRELTRTAAGDPDAGFWESIYMPQEIYGGEAITGWLLRFFPHVLDFESDAREALPSEPVENPEASRQVYQRNPGLAAWSLESAWQNRTGAPTPIPTEAHRPWLCSGLELEALPPGFSGAPVRMLNLDGRCVGHVQVMSGFVGVAQHDNLALEARVGWAVVEGEEPLKRMR